jgi:Ser/Thr protein kinase RdoA (MazF antagonist)
LPRAHRPAEVSRECAQDVVAAAGIDARVVGASPLGEGVKSVVSRIELAGAEPLALKVFRLSGYAAREHAAYRSLGDHDLALPRMVHGVAESEHFPFGFTLMTISAGVPLNFKFGGLARERLLDVYRGVGALQRQIHRNRPPTEMSNLEYMERRVSESLGKFLERGGSRRLAGKLERFFTRSAALFAQCDQPALCHGDLHPENIFVRGDAATLAFEGAIDLESAFIGDPVMDLTRTIHTCPLPGVDLTEALLDGYGGAPPGFADRHHAYFVLYELELWSYYALGGSRAPLRSIARRLRKHVRS